MSKIETHKNRFGDIHLPGQTQHRIAAGGFTRSPIQNSTRSRKFIRDVWRPEFAPWLLDDPTHGIIRFVHGAEQRKVVRRVANLHREGCTTLSDWEAVIRSLRSMRHSRCSETMSTAMAAVFHVAQSGWAVATTLSGCEKWEASYAQDAADVAADVFAVAAFVAAKASPGRAWKQALGRAYRVQQTKLQALKQAA